MTRTTAKVFVAMLDVEIDHVSDFGALRSFDALRTEERCDGDEQKPERETAEQHSDEDEVVKVRWETDRPYPQNRYVSDQDR